MVRGDIARAAVKRPVLPRSGSTGPAAFRSRPAGTPALHRGCASSTVRPVVDVLLDAGAPVDPMDQWGNAPLWRAVFNAKGDPQIVRRLVQAGADPEKHNNAGRTPRQLTSMIANHDTTGPFAGTESG
jgi:hypothetical protein